MSLNHQRHSDIFNPDTITQRRVIVIGCGTIGSFTAMALHKMGVTNVELWDFDRVEDVNLPAQNFDAKDVRKMKCDVLAKRYGYTSNPMRYEYQLGHEGAIAILAVDSLEARREILSLLPDNVTVIDGRMGGEGYEVHIGSKMSIRVPLEASEELCTAKGIIYVSMGISADIAALVKRILLNQAITYKTLFRDYRTGDTLAIKL